MRMKSILLTGVFAVMCLFTYAQEERDLKKEVKVRTDFKPKINKTGRIEEMPDVVDTVILKTHFDYSIRSKSLDVNFKPSSIQAAKMTDVPSKKVHGHSLDLAAGNYSTLFADYRYNNLNWKKTDVGLHLQHYSTNGKLELNDGSQVRPDWKEFLAEVYGNHYLNRGKMSSRIFFKNKSFNYYGSSLSNDILGKTNTFNYDDQRYNNVGLETSYETLNKSDKDLDYKLGVAFEYFTDKYDVNEIDAGINGGVQLKKGDGLWSLASSLNLIMANNLVYYNAGLKERDLTSTLLLVNPAYDLNLSKFNMRLGAKVQTVLGNDSEFKIYPDFKFNLVLIDKVLDMFVGLDGDLDVNTIRSISSSNPFVHSGLDVENTSTNYRVYGGLKTKISLKSSALFSVEYADIDNQYFFSMANAAIAPQGGLLFQHDYSNKYAVVYDDLSKLSFRGELDLQLDEKLNLNTLAKYTNYTLNNIEEAWHMPKVEMETKATYAFTDQWLFNARLLFVGERKVMTDRNVGKLGALADLGVGAEYKWNDIFSAYINVNNIFNSEAYLWYGYPSQGINGMFGVKIVF